LQSDREQLHAAAQQFMDFYYDISSRLVAVLLNNHVKNITLHQYHRATYHVKKFHPKVMVKGKLPIIYESTITSVCVCLMSLVNFNQT